MKTLYVLGFCLILLTSANAQKLINKNFAYKANEKIVLNLRFGDNIKITAWDKNEVDFSASVKINENKLNDALLVKFSENDELTISSDFDEEKMKEAKCGDCLDGKGFSYKNGNRICSEITYEIKVPKTADVKVETISSNIEIIGHEGPLYAKSISGFIDMTRETGKGADVFLETITGECYSDLNISMENPDRQKHRFVDLKIKGKVNGGGVPIHLATISNNIYLRKKGRS